MDNVKTFGWRLRLMTGLRRFAAIVPLRRGREDEQRAALPPFPFHRESFALILDELAQQGGSGPGEQESSQAKPSWLTLPESALRNGIFVTGTVGSGMTNFSVWPSGDKRVPAPTAGGPTAGDHHE
jgi:hypothetical protein